MREINKTIYEILKVSGPDEDVSVTQLITDEVVKQSESGEIQATRKEDATGLLDRKALELAQEAELAEQKKEGTNTGIRRQIKASGKKPRAAGTNPDATGTRKIQTSKTGKVTGKKKVAKKTAGTKTKKIAKASKKAPEKKEGGTDLTKILLLIVLLGVAGYLYMELGL